MIAVQVSDKDLASLALTCRGFRCALSDHGFWRLRFHEEFDRPMYLRDSTTNIVWKHKYQTRKVQLSRDTDFNRCGTGEVKAMVTLLKELILEATPELNAFGAPICKNFDVIERLFFRSSILRNLFKQPLTGHHTYKRAFQTVMVCLGSHFFNLEQYDRPPIYGFPSSQISAYDHVGNAPIMDGAGYDKVNMAW
jgi:hypothetical protein